VKDCVYSFGKCRFCGSPLGSPRVRQNCPSARVQDEHHDLATRPVHKPPANGPGTELKKLLAGWPFHITASPECSCNARARMMDESEAKSPGWCEEHLDEIVGWLREEAGKRGLPFLDLAGRVLVRRAIANARREHARAGRPRLHARG
jgi:hypothetical protein